MTHKRAESSGRRRVLLICGLPGTGKSTVANDLHAILGWPIVSTEVMRSRLFDRKAASQDVDFSDIELQVVYRAVAVVSEYLSSEGINVIVEGVFRSREQRNLVLDVAARLGLNVTKVVLRGNEREILSRLAKRQSHANVAPAGPRAFRQIKRGFEPVQRDFLAYNTTREAMSEICLSILREIENG